MALKSNWNEGRSMQDLNRQLNNLNTKIINSYIRAGENFIKSSREQVQSHSLGTYKDQTTNLRNSIGYYIFHNGELVYEKSFGNQAENLQKVQVLVKARGIQLIGIAGMNYASHVESLGYNVISYQADICMVDLAMYLETLEVIESGSAARMEDTFTP
jgi:hypothetical protein